MRELACYTSEVGSYGTARAFHPGHVLAEVPETYRGADKSLVRPTSRCMVFDGENISFDASLVIYIYIYIYIYIVLIFLLL